MNISHVETLNVYEIINVKILEKIFKHFIYKNYKITKIRSQLVL